MSRMDKIRADMNKKVARPAGDVDALELRKDAAVREMAAYMKEAAPRTTPSSISSSTGKRGARMG